MRKTRVSSLWNGAKGGLQATNKVLLFDPVVVTQCVHFVIIY